MQPTLSNGRVLLAEDHPLILMGIRYAINQIFPDAEVVRADNFSKTLRAIDDQEFGLLVLDIDIPGGDKVEMIHMIRRKCPTLPILINSSYDERLYALPYLRAGANGFISKTASEEEFKAAVEAVVCLKIYASPAVLQSAFGQVNQAKKSDSAIGKLTERELDIARLLSNGMSTTQIGTIVSLSLPSVSNYKARIFEKLGINNIIELRTHLALNEENYMS